MGERVFSVDTASLLRLRRQADGDSEILARLAPGQVVARLDEEDRDGWYWVFADVPGEGAFVGYVAGRFLAPRTSGQRAPLNGPVLEPPSPPTPPPMSAPLPAPVVSPFVQALVRACEEELARFGDGRLKEADEPARGWIGEYWKELGQESRDGASDFAWSAAFISSMMRKAGAGGRFRYSAAHCDYINDALRQKDNPSAAFQAMRPEAYAPRVGDLIARARPTPRNPTEATFETARSLGFYTSHTDIVTSISEQALTTIGGNVGNSVSRTLLPLTADGRIQASALRSGKIFAILRNNLA